MGSGSSRTHVPRGCDGLDGLLDMEQEASSNQELLERGGEERRPPCKQSKLESARWDGVIAPALGNFSVQYNFQAIAIALAIAKRSSATPQRGWVNSQCKSAVFTGCILGQFCMGYVGDLIGRARALYLTLVMSAFGAVASAALPWGNAMTIYTIVIVARFVIGFGLGGVYPLSATHAAESSQAHDATGALQDKAEATARAADAFFWQTPGYVAPYLVTIVLRGLMQSTDQSLQWRLLLGLGAVPATAVIILCRPSHDDSITAKFGSQTANTNNALRASLVKPSTWRLLAGTGGGWLLYDVAFYGFTLMGPVVVSSCFDRHESVMDEAWQQTIALSFAAPAVLTTTHLIRRGFEPKRLQYMGFYLMAFAYVALAGLRHANYSGWSLFLSYCFLNFCLNLGPNVCVAIRLASRDPTFLTQDYLRASKRNLPSNNTIHYERRVFCAWQTRRRPWDGTAPGSVGLLRAQRRPPRLCSHLGPWGIRNSLVC